MKGRETAEIERQARLSCMLPTHDDDDTQSIVLVAFFYLLRKKHLLLVSVLSSYT